VRIELRMDSAGALPAIYDWCEAEGILYTIGLITNSRLTAIAAPLVAEVLRQRLGRHPAHLPAGLAPMRS